MKFISHGAAKEVTGSCHELQIDTKTGTKRILIDCGLFQGHREEAARKNAAFPFDPATDIDVLLLTHAHMDHVGRIPLLWKKGYRGSVLCTYATKDLSEVMLQDAGYIQEKDEEYFLKHLAKSKISLNGPLFTQKDAAACMKLFKGQNYGEWFPVCEGARAKFLEAGHIVGAVMIILEIFENGKTTTMAFSGDLGRSSLPIIRDPAPLPPVDILVCESTYGNRKHEDISTATVRLKEAIVKTAERGGKVFIPAFSLERTQEILFDLHVLWDTKEIPAVPIIVDSPLASRVTEVFMKHPECYDKDMYDKFLSKSHNPFQFSLVRETVTPEESKEINGISGPMIVIAGSGMCEAGRIRHHLRNGLEDPRNCVVVVGFMAENTLGRKIVDPTITAVKIFDDVYQKKAEIINIYAYSGHADMADLDHYILSAQGLKHLMLVHGEESEMLPLEERMRRVIPGINVTRAERGSVYDL